MKKKIKMSVTNENEMGTLCIGIKELQKFEENLEKHTGCSIENKIQNKIQENNQENILHLLNIKINDNILEKIKNQQKIGNIIINEYTSQSLSVDTQNIKIIPEIIKTNFKDSFNHISNILIIFSKINKNKIKKLASIQKFNTAKLITIDIETTPEFILKYFSYTFIKKKSKWFQKYSVILNIELASLQIELPEK